MPHQLTCLSTGRTYHYLDQRPEHSGNGTTMLCVHGFPDLSYGWRHQIGPWVAGGYRVVVPDMLGYGKTDMPLEASAYTTKRLCDDLAALLDHLGVQKAVVIGHDWGAFIAGRFALWHPDRLLALILLSIPYNPPPTHHVPPQELAERYPSYGYQVYFASEQSTAEIDARLSLFLRIAFRDPSRTNISVERLGKYQEYILSGKEPGKCLLNDEDLEYYVSNFQRGMIGPLSYYRTTKFRFEEEKEAALPSKLRADLPVLFIYGTEDATCPPVSVKNMGIFVDQLKVVPISGIGHWIMLQAPQAVAEEVLQWLASALGIREPVRL